MQCVVRGGWECGSRPPAAAPPLPHPPTHPPPTHNVPPLLLQRRLLEALEQKNVEENYLSAVEHNPESFAQVTML